MKTIAVMNPKGGTGKTTSAINLAGELVRRGKKVLIVDMDTQGNATSNLSLTEIPAATLTDTVCHTSTENLDLIRGGSLLAPALAAMQEMPFGRDTTLRRLLPQASRDAETLAAVSANVSANLLGLGNAATPLGIQAACRMARGCGGTASDELCLLVVLNTASIQLLPTTVASIRAAYGSAAPFDILPAVWVSSLASVTVGLLTARFLSRRKRGHL